MVFLLVTLMGVCSATETFRIILKTNKSPNGNTLWVEYPNGSFLEYDIELDTSYYFVVQSAVNESMFRKIVTEELNVSFAKHNSSYDVSNQSYMQIKDMFYRGIKTDVQDFMISYYYPRLAFTDALNQTVRDMNLTIYQLMADKKALTDVVIIREQQMADKDKNYNLMMGIALISVIAAFVSIIDWRKIRQDLELRVR